MLLAVGLLGLLVVALSFLPWMTISWYPGVNVSGTDMRRFTDAGDGWVTAIAGAAAALVAIVALLLELRSQIVASAIAACGLLIACVSGYDLINGWYGTPPSVLGGGFTFEIHREPALWATPAAGIVIATAGFALLAAANRRPYADDPNERSGTEAWA